jgi:hypothetical protein
MRLPLRILARGLFRSKPGVTARASLSRGSIKKGRLFAVGAWVSTHGCAGHSERRQEAAAAEAHADPGFGLRLQCWPGSSQRYRDEAFLMYGNRRGGPTWETPERRRLFVLAVYLA